MATIMNQKVAVQLLPSACCCAPGQGAGTSRYLSLLGGLNKPQIQQKTRRGTSEKLTPKRVRISNMTYSHTTRFLVNGG